MNDLVSEYQQYQDATIDEEAFEGEDEMLFDDEADFGVRSPSVSLAHTHGLTPKQEPEM